jgi:hypothetical protein
MTRRRPRAAPGTGSRGIRTLARQAALISSLALAIASRPVLADADPPKEGSYEAILDLDQDGKMDKAIVTQQPGGGPADLAIYLSVGNGPLDPSRQPTLFKKTLTAQRVLALSGAGKGSLIVQYGCGGCSNDEETSLRIVHRGGEFLVAGFTQAWDTRNGLGRCEIDFLKGARVVSQGLDEAKRARGKFAPVRLKLADWSDDRRAEACGF